MKTLIVTIMTIVIIIGVIIMVSTGFMARSARISNLERSLRRLLTRYEALALNGQSEGDPNGLWDPRGRRVVVVLLLRLGVRMVKIH